MFNSTPKHSYKDLFEGMIIGGGLTGLAVFLFGTKKGKEIQKEFIKKYRKLRHRAEVSMKMLGYGSKVKKISHKTKSRKKTHRRKGHFAKAA